MLEANPRLTPPQIGFILTQTARPLAHTVRERQGAGVLRAGDAVAAALKTT
jgi:hypothetical protein